MTQSAPSVPQEEFDAAQAQIQELESQVEQKDSKISDLETQLDQAEEMQADLESEIEDLQAQVETLSSERDDALSEAASLQQRVSTYECDQSLTGMQYGDILNSSTILSAWVAQQSFAQRISGTHRDSIWNNTDSKIHGVRYIGASDNQPYVTYFMVYFDEFDWDTGVFWIEGQCWLER